MSQLTTSLIAGITGGRLVGSPGLAVTELLTDSRLFSPGGDIAFIAISGDNHDGHRFIRQLYDRGVRIFIAEKLPDDIDYYAESAFIIVPDSVTALQDIAAFRRSRFSGQVIAVTGSAGKTVVKEWMAEILGAAYPLIRSPKSYNSRIGVPLSVWKLDSRYSIGIFEAGISKPGEMSRLERIIKPDIGVITNIGDAHSENFTDLRQKASEKLDLFRNCGAIVYCSDYTIIDELLRGDDRFSSGVLTDWSFSRDDAKYRVERKTVSIVRTDITIVSDNGNIDFTIPFSDKASVENAVTAAIACLAAGAPRELVINAMPALSPVAMRMEIKNGINGCMLIEDYYNSDPGSLRMALDYLSAFNSRQQVLILSDFIQSGRDERELYGEVAGLVVRNGIGRFIGIGEALYRQRELFPPGSRFFYSTDDFLNHFSPAGYSNETILLKGARVFLFEKIGAMLEQQVHQTVLEVNLDAISANLNEFRKHLNQGTRIMAMVKAFAYGAGPSEIASLLEFHRIDYLAVACADEGVALREAGVTAPVVVMNPEPSAFSQMIRYNLEPEIYSLSLLDRFAVAVSRYGAPGYPVHIKIDTGMHRLGFMPGETEELIRAARGSDNIKVISVFSHLAASEDPQFDSFTIRQAETFINITSRLRDGLGYPFLRHLLNSSGIVRFPEYQFEMVRPGIGLYGIGGHGILDLRPAGRYVTRILQVKRIPAGEPVGYGCADISERERLIAVLPVGYADGLSRMMGNGKGRLFVKGHYVPLAGNVCMDMCMADITGTGAEEGDEAEIFGGRITVEEVAEKCGTIPYEILTSIPPRVKRIFYRE